MNSINAERCLAFDEKPLLLANQLKQSGNENEDPPIFVLKHIKQVKSPGSRSSDWVDRDASTPLVSTYLSGRTDPVRPGPILSASAPLTSGGFSGLTAFEEKKPFIEKKSNEIGMGASTGTSAVAIYEYLAERDDELNVTIGEKFTIISRETGWFVVVDKNGKRGWVPSGCLLEETEEAVMNGDIDSDQLGRGIVLQDYGKMGLNELSIRQNDVVTIYKRYQHWFYAEKEGGGARGWVPSCYVSLEGANSGGNNIWHFIFISFVFPFFPFFFLFFPFFFLLYYFIFILLKL